MKPMEKGLSQQETFDAINPGDKISIYTKDSEKHLVVVESITPDYIKGDGKVINYKDIVEIRQEKFSPLKTTSAVLGVGGLVIVTLVMLMLIAAGG